MMKSFILTISFLIPTLLMNAQGDREQMREKMKQRMESMKIAFITNAIDLSSEEAEKFWPVYNEFQKELEAVRGDEERPGPPPKGDDFENMSDAEVAKKLDEQFEKEQKVLEIKKKYLNKFKEVIPVKKVAKLYRAEHEFKRRILEEFKKRREAH